MVVVHPGYWAHHPAQVAHMLRPLFLVLADPLSPLQTVGFFRL